MFRLKIAKPKIGIILIFIITAVNTAIVGAHHNLESMSCYSCHIAHNYLGPSLTTYDTINNLCRSCHYVAGPVDPPSDYRYHEREDCTTCHDPNTDVITIPGAGHSVHMTEVRGPKIADCADCHDTADYPYFYSGTDGDGDDKYSLSETDVCDPCHSPGGAYNGVESVGLSIGAKTNWEEGIYDTDTTLKAGKGQWCIGCHDEFETAAVIQGVKAPDVSLFWTVGHGRGAGVACEACHDTNLTHIDGEPRTYEFDTAYYPPGQSGVAYAAGYRLQYVGGDVPLMIPANYATTFGYDAGLMRDTAFRLCFECHDVDTLFDNTPGDGISSNFKASLPNPPRNYSYAWGSGADVNEHVSHIMNYMGSYADSDWYTGTTGKDGSDGRDTTMACSSCHNVHGAIGFEGSTNEAMIRDGSLVGRTNGEPRDGDYDGGYGFSYVIEDGGAGGYPWVTSTGATQATSVGAIFRNNTGVYNMCGGSMCHGNPTPPAGSSYDASGSSWGTYLEYYRPWTDY